ncbi:hypothetical protein AUK11_00135 [bacterium CG2_30_37_16]|nr:MAG: hypothetical protein AUK11_00135 [bacterium CG2_30_37_16]
MYQKSFSPSKGRQKGSFNSSNKNGSRYQFSSPNSANRNQFGDKEGSNKGQFSFSTFDRGSFGSSRRFNKPYGRSNNFSRSKRNYSRPSNDYSQYIKKASPVTEQNEYSPKNKFADFNINQALKSNIISKGYETPTPIQDQAIPYILDGKDVIGLANTGTGKTGAFIVPLIDKVYKDKRQKILIVTPTRELASQIDAEFREFSKGMGIFSTQIIGGASMGKQISSLYRNPNFIIGTPGRLNDLIKRGRLKLSGFQNIVLDEVDRMLDMGFIEDIQKILSFLPDSRQSLFFSATISPRISNLIKGFLDNPVTITVKSAVSPENIEQDIIKVTRDQNKLEVLHELLIKEEFDKVLIFGKTKRGVDMLSNELEKRGFKASSIHGDKPQNKRERALRQFKQDELNILVATDVAARGLDINNVSHVINYDLPENYDDYIHRIGRTGRAGKSGKALTFVG